MAKKRTGLSQTLFGEINPYGDEIESPGASTTAPQYTFALTTIRPDPRQPRQLLPPDVSAAVTSGASLPSEALERWLKQADQAEADPALKHNAEELRRLASSIEQHGLINPITLRRPRSEETVPAGVEYLIVTGERRYWSHVLLALEGRQIHEGNAISSSEQIKALVTNEGVSIRAHQLIENLMREDINAVEKARGLWALRYELSGVNHGSPPLPAPPQVNHGSPVPPTAEEQLVSWSKVEEALDISKRYRIFVTSVLNLSAEAQQLVMRHNMSERLIRPIVQKLKERPELQVEALQQLVAWRDSDEAEASQPMTDLAQALVEQLLARQDQPAIEPNSTKTKMTPASHRIANEAAAFRARVQGALRFLNKLQEPEVLDLTRDLATAQEYADVVENLKDLRERIDTILEAIAIYNAKSS